MTVSAAAAPRAIMSDAIAMPWPPAHASTKASGTWRMENGSRDGFFPSYALWENTHAGGG
jgi:hypothetical protein